MISLIINILVKTVAVYITAYLLPGITVPDFTTALLVAVVLGIVNAILKPILIFFTLPITILTLGLFTLVINALLVLLVEYLVPGFMVDGFLWALAFGIVLTVINSLLRGLIRD